MRITTAIHMDDPLPVKTSPRQKSYGMAERRQPNLGRCSAENLQMPDNHSQTGLFAYFEPVA
jgi:hypothetical protein